MNAFELADAEEEMLARALQPEGGEEGQDEGEGANYQALPSSGSAYLARVMKEAEKIDDVMVASNADKLCSLPVTSATHVTREKAGLPSKFLPPEKWADQQVRDFSMFRLRLGRHLAFANNSEEGQKEAKERAKMAGVPDVPGKEKEKEWCVFCHGAPFWNSVCAALKAKDSDSDEDEEDNTAPVNESNSAGRAPLTTLLCSLRPNVVVRVLEYHVGWCEAVDMVLPGGGVLGDVTSPSAPMMGEWLFALLARLEKPLHPDVESSLRTLALVAAKQRLALAREEVSGDGQPDPRINGLTLFVCLVAKYFGQSDLAD